MDWGSAGIGVLVTAVIGAVVGGIIKLRDQSFTQGEAAKTREASEQKELMTKMEGMLGIERADKLAAIAERDKERAAHTDCEKRLATAERRIARFEVWADSVVATLEDKGLKIRPLRDEPPTEGSKAHTPV